MYIQRNKSRYKSGQEYVTPLLCSKYREDGKVKTKVLANLSGYTEEQVLSLEAALKRSRGEKMVAEQEISVEKCVDFGYFFLIQALMKRLRIDKVLRQALPAEHVANVRAMIIGKLLTCGSKLSIYHLLQREAALAGILSIDKRLKVDDLYNSLEILDACQPRIDSQWVDCHEVEENSIYLYDQEYQARGHVQVCFWAHVVSKALEDKIYPFLKAFNEENRGQLSFNDIIAELKNIKLVELTLGKGVRTVKYAKLSDLQQKILGLFNLSAEDMVAMMSKQ
ncbi:MAG: hypothetical protein LBG47_00930 [Prevotellaceae bacterium]|jgi:hypothetical protein|nr:hypothetical protein [Prevotellaceae bacterium]